MRAVVLAACLALTAAAASAAVEPVSIRLPSAVLASPAHVRIVVLVEPDAANRLLTLEVDGAPLYRASEVPLAGDHEKRSHVFEEKSLQAGRYKVRAVVYGPHDARATQVRELLVVGR